MDDKPVRRSPRRYAYLLLALPFAGTLAPGLYAHAEPAIGGVPFFYWYQFVWIALTAVVSGAVYALTREKRS